MAVKTERKIIIISNRNNYTVAGDRKKVTPLTLTHINVHIVSSKRKQHLVNIDKAW